MLAGGPVAADGGRVYQPWDPSVLGVDHKFGSAVIGERSHDKETGCGSSCHMGHETTDPVI